MSKSKEEQPLTTSAEDDLETAPLHPAIIDALGPWCLPPTARNVADDDVAKLAESDRQASALRSTIEKVVQKVLDERSAQRHTTPSQPSVEPADTILIDVPSTTVPAPGCQLLTNDSAKGVGDLMDALRKIEDNSQLGWTTRYRKKQKLGQGGQGIVYLAESFDEFGGEHALKIYSPERYKTEQLYHEEMQRLMRVAGIVHRIHPENVVYVERCIEQKGIYAMVMQRLNGHDLYDLTQPNLATRLCKQADNQRSKELESIFAVLDDGTLSIKPGCAVKIMELCLRGLEALHDKQIVHCDIKPSNIMLDDLGSVRIIDIGSASELDCPPQFPAWSPHYAPLEVLEAWATPDVHAWTPAGDLASLGYVLVELLSGKSIVPNPQADDHTADLVNPKRIKELIKAKRELPNRLTKMLPSEVQKSNLLVSLCQRLIHPDPAKRFASATDAIVADDGTFSFLAQLSEGKLIVSYPQVIRQWIKDVNNAVAQDVELSATTTADFAN